MPVSRLLKINIFSKLLYNIISIFIFSIIYYIIERIDKNAFSDEFNYPEAIYFSSTTNFTLGFGDVLPQSPIARIMVVVQSMIFYIITIAV